MLLWALLHALPSHLGCGAQWPWHGTLRYQWRSPSEGDQPGVTDMGVLALPRALEPETSIQDLLAVYFGWGETGPSGAPSRHKLNHHLLLLVLLLLLLLFLPRLIISITLLPPPPSVKARISRLSIPLTSSPCPPARNEDSGCTKAYRGDATSISPSRPRRQKLGVTKVTAP